MKNDKKTTGALPEKEIEKGSGDESPLRAEDVILPLPQSGPRGRGRPSKTEKAIRDQEQIAQEAAKKIFTGEIWKPVACLPFDLCFLGTKYEGFLLTNEEAERSGLLLAKVLEVYAPELDARTMVTVAFAVDYLTLFARKGMAWNTWKKQTQNYQKPQNLKANPGLVSPKNSE